MSLKSTFLLRNGNREVSLFTVIMLLLCLQANRAEAQVYSNPDSLIHGFYRFLTGEPHARNWTVYKSFFHEKAISGAVIVDAQGNVSYRSFTPAEYGEKNDSFFRSNAFRITEIHKTTQRFGNLMHVLSTYEFSVANAKNAGRGINSFQLIFDKERWWIVSLQYINERPGLPLPRELGGQNN